MESLYVELRQNYPGNQLHLMLVSPFIVETGELHVSRVSSNNVVKLEYLFTGCEGMCQSTHLTPTHTCDLKL